MCVSNVTDTNQEQLTFQSRVVVAHQGVHTEQVDQREVTEHAQHVGLVWVEALSGEKPEEITRCASVLFSRVRGEIVVLVSVFKRM